MKGRMFFWLTVVLLLMIGLGACGGSSDEGSGGTQGDAVSSGDPAKGEELYNQVCVACHGPGGEGIEGLGKPFTTSEFLKSKNDQEMLAFVKQGRPIGDPLNTTGVDMPPKGGNPALTDEQILDIIAYVRTLQ